MDLIHVTVCVGGKPYSRTGGTLSQWSQHDQTRQRRCFSEKGDAPLDRVWVSQGGFRPLCPKQRYIFVKTTV